MSFPLHALSRYALQPAPPRPDLPVPTAGRRPTRPHLPTQRTHPGGQRRPLRAA